MAENKKLRSQALDMLRFPLAVVIVTIHVFAYYNVTMQGKAYNLTDFSGFMTLVMFAKSFLAGQSVPVYFFISGYVFFLGINLTMETYWRKMKNRFHSLLIPYVLWNTLAIVLVLITFLPALHGIFPNSDWSRVHITGSDIFSCYWIYDACFQTSPSSGVLPPFPIDIPLWFVRDLMLVALVTPLINSLLKHYGGALPLVSGALWLVLPNVVTGHAYQLLTALFFFSFGGWLSFNQRDMVEEFRKYRGISFWVYPLSAICLFVYCFIWGDKVVIAADGFINTPMQYVKNIAILSGLFFAYNFVVYLIERHGLRPSKTLSSASFFVYAAHMIFLPYLLKVFMLVLPPVSDVASICLYLLTDVALCIGLLYTYVFMRRYLPSLLSPFTGGRF